MANKYCNLTGTNKIKYEYTLINDGFELVENDMMSGSPAGVYANLAALTIAFPDGDSKVYVTTDNGNWNYWNGSAWIAGGLYQSPLTDSPANTIKGNDTGATAPVKDLSISEAKALLDIDDLETQLAESMQQVNESLNEKANLAELQQISLSYKESYDTLALLQTAYPTGDIYNHAVLADGLIYTYTDSQWISTGIQANGTGITDGGVSVKKLDFYTNDSIGMSLISDLDFDTVGKLNSSGGIYTVNTAYKTTSNFFPVENGDYIESHNNIAAKRGMVSACFYTSASESDFLSSAVAAYATGIIVVPTGAKYARFSIAITNLTTYPNIKVQKGTTVIPINIERLGKLNGVRTENEVIYNDITVGTGKDFTTLNSAIEFITSINDVSENNRYKVYIHEGIYDVFANLTTTQTERGIILPDYVYLIGVGVKENIIIKGEHAIGEDDNNVYMRSTLNINKNNGLKNLTVTAKNCRYAVHADNSNFYKNYIWEIEDCDFIHDGNDASFTWQTIIAWGSGSASGAKEYFKNCKFIGNTGYTNHNNVSFIDSTYQEFINCKFVGAVRLESVGLISMGSGVKHTVKFIGCQFTGLISAILSGASDVEFDIIGHSNSKVAHSLPSTSSKFINFSDEINTSVVVSSAITKGKPIRDYGWQVEPQYATGTKFTYYGGIALNDANVGEVCYFKHSGFIDLTNILTVVDGNYVGVVGGNLAVVQNRGDAIGQVLHGNKFLKLFSISA